MVENKVDPNFTREAWEERFVTVERRYKQDPTNEFNAQCYRSMQKIRKYFAAHPEVLSLRVLPPDAEE